MALGAADHALQPLTRLGWLLSLRSPQELERANQKLDAANKDLEQFAYVSPDAPRIRVYLVISR